MAIRELEVINTGLDFDQVDWDRYIKRWLLYAYRYIPHSRCVDAKSAEDVVFQAINAVISGRRTYARPNIFADSTEPDHQSPFFVYVCGVIRSIARASYLHDNRYTGIHQYVDDDGSKSSAGNYSELLVDPRGSIESGWMQELEQRQQLNRFKSYLCNQVSAGDDLCIKIADSITAMDFCDLPAQEKAAALGVGIGAYNNALKRFKRILNKFVAAHGEQQSSTGCDS